MILPYDVTNSYRGVDRNPFEPQIIMDAVDNYNIHDDSIDIWMKYHPEWRYDAYRLYEENRVNEWGEDYLITDYQIAKRIVNIIEPYLGIHEIIKCCIIGIIDAHPINMDNIPCNGYDIAYPGGDYYSAIYNGLIFNGGNPKLVNKYKKTINKHGLFESDISINKYLSEFKNIVKSEANSDYCLYKITLLENY